MVHQTIQEKINQRRRQILVHSFLYYQMNTSIITDHQYDFFCQDLIRLQAEYPEIAETCVYADEFRGFSMGDSFKLPYHYPEIQSKGLQLLRYNNDEN